MNSGTSTPTAFARHSAYGAQLRALLASDLGPDDRQRLTELDTYVTALLAEDTTCGALAGLEVLSLSADMTAFELFRFAHSPQIYKEDFGLWIALLEMAARSASRCPNPTGIAPMYLHAYVGAPERLWLNEEILRIKRLRASQPTLWCSLHDFSLRNIPRSTKFERQVLGHAAGLFEEFDANDILLCFESTVDLQTLDLPIFPVPTTPFCPVNAARDLQFSFVGEYYVAAWPADMPRGSDNVPIWNAFRASTAESSFVGTKAEALRRFSGSNPYHDVPARSVFTLCPRGIAGWTYRTIEAIRAGSIPVLLSDDFRWPLASRIDWDGFTVTIRERELNRVPERLAALGGAEVARLQAQLARAQQQFSFRGLVEAIEAELSARLSTTPPTVSQAGPSSDSRSP